MTDSSSNIYICGNYRGTIDFNPTATVDNRTSSPSTEADIFLTKYNSAGTYQWTYTYGSIWHDSCHEMVVDGSNNLFYAGIVNGGVTSPYPTMDFDPTAGTDNRTIYGTSMYVTKMNAANTYGFTHYTDSGVQPFAFTVANNYIYVGGSYRNGYAADFDPTPIWYAPFTNATNDRDGFISRYNPYP